MQPIASKTFCPASAEPFSPSEIGCAGGRGVAVLTRYSVIARASRRVRRISSGLELFSSMKKCGILVLGRNALGAQIHVLMYAGDNFDVMLRRSVPTLRCPFATINRISLGCLGGVSPGMLSIW